MYINIQTGIPKYENTIIRHTLRSLRLQPAHIAAQTGGVSDITVSYVTLEHGSKALYVSTFTLLCDEFKQQIEMH